MSLRLARLTLACLPLALAAGVARADEAVRPEPAVAPATRAAPGLPTTAGGVLRLRWNDALLSFYGLRREPGGEGDRSGWVSVALDRKGGLRLDADRIAIRGLAGGSVGLDDGLAVVQRDRGWRWKADRLRAVAAPTMQIEVVGQDGAVAFVVDRVMVELLDEGRRFGVRSADLRIAPALARRLGRPDAAGLVVAEVTLEAPWKGPLPAGGRKSPPRWPGSTGPGGEVFLADVFMTTFEAQFSRCRRSGDPDTTSTPCDGPGPDDGVVVFTPSSTLRNNVNDGTPLASVPGDPLGTSAALHTADVEWETKFTNRVAGPYPSPDQHPYLIWNLYRLDADGGIRQIGASGVKHAFLTINQSDAGFPACDNSNGFNVLGRACSDVYGVGNNDSDQFLAPRSEIVPAAGLWGRCGSVFDPDCTGGLTVSDPNTPYSSRMRVRESDLDPAGEPGFLFESWYLVRDDIEVRNTMGTRPVSITWGANGPWAVGNGRHPGTTNAIVLGPAVERWVAQDRAGLSYAARHVAPLRTPEGQAWIGAKVRQIAPGEWRYDWVVQNLDFARAVTSGTEGAPGGAGLRVLRNDGFGSFSVPLAAGATILSVAAVDADGNPSNDWAATVMADRITWRAPDAAASLDWGLLHRFTVVADRGPVDGADEGVLGVAEAGAPATYAVQTLGIGRAAALFDDGFE